MKRAANMSRVLPAIIRSRHGAYLDRSYWEHERAAQRRGEPAGGSVRPGGSGYAMAGWRGEVNAPGLTQVRPDLLVPVSDGPFGPGPYYIEYERHAILPYEVAQKLGPYRRMATLGRPLPLLMVCRTEQAEANFREARGELSMLTATYGPALTGPLTGIATVWRLDGAQVALHCRG